MADVQNNAPVKLAPEIVRAVTRDPELRRLPPGSPEYQAAFAKKFGDGDTKKTESAPVAKTETDETKTEVSADNTQIPADDKDDAERNLLSKKAQRRFDKLSAEKKALEARVAELEASGKSPKAAEKQAEAETRQAPSSTFDKPKPKLEDFQGKPLSDYNEALIDWKAEKREFDKELAGKARTAQEKVESSVKSFQEKGKSLEKELDLDPGDFDDAMSDRGFKLYDTSRFALFESDFGPQIAYEIASDDEVKERFAKMSAVQQLTFIGKLEAKYEAKKVASAESSKPISGAKAPGKPLQKGSSGPTAGLKYKPGDFRAYEAMRKEQQPNRFKR